MKSKRNIPESVAKVVGNALGSYYRSHKKLDNLFLDNGAPGKPPAGRNLVDKCEVWLKSANSEPTIDALDLLGKILVVFMEFDDPQEIASQQQGRVEINKELAKHGLSYCQGGSIIDESTKISEVTRRDIMDAITVGRINWFGRLEEPKFLARIYDFTSDSRFSNAEGEIWQHRVNNPGDWDDNWIFLDERFELMDGNDETFLKFLCESLHPVVRKDVTEVEKLCQLYNSFLKNDGFQLIEKTKLSGKPVYTWKSLSDASLSHDEIAVKKPLNNGDLFTKQFPLGLPFGLKKPNLAVIPMDRGQNAFFEEEPQIGVLKENVYPNLSFPHLFKMLQNSDISGVPPDMKTLADNLVAMNESDYEKEFFRSYSNKYKIAKQETVPVLIPQAWIQWHSQTKQNLRSQGSSYADDPYRVDFVAFWKDQRFVILVDGIEHYANKQNHRWDADEEKYSNRLKEDRKLRKEGWQVFRVSNWEIRNGLIDEILVDLKEFLGF